MNTEINMIKLVNEPHSETLKNEPHPETIIEAMKILFFTIHTDRHIQSNRLDIVIKDYNIPYYDSTIS